MVKLYSDTDEGINIANKFLTGESDWKLSFKHKGYPVEIVGSEGLDMTTVTVGDNHTDIYIVFPFKSEGMIDNVINSAKLHIDEYMKDYELERGVLN